jgi:elongation factor Ts
VAISTDLVKQLREQTGAGIMDSKRALQEANGDLEKAAAILKQQGFARAEKKAGRIALQGLIEPYVHAGGRIGSLVEVNCETDFVARTDDFKNLAHDIAMQIAAMAPRYIRADQIHEEDFPKLEQEFGSREEAIKQTVLLEQTFIRDSKATINDLIASAIAKMGENISVYRFARFEVGADRPATDESGEA